MHLRNFKILRQNALGMGITFSCTAETKWSTSLFSNKGNRFFFTKPEPFFVGNFIKPCRPSLNLFTSPLLKRHFKFRNVISKCTWKFHMHFLAIQIPRAHGISIFQYAFDVQTNKIVESWFRDSLHLHIQMHMEI